MVSRVIACTRENPGCLLGSANYPRDKKSILDETHPFLTPIVSSQLGLAVNGQIENRDRPGVFNQPL